MSESPTKNDSENNSLSDSINNSSGGNENDPPKTVWKGTQPFKNQSQKQFIDCYSPRVQSDNSITLSTSTSLENLTALEKDAQNANNSNSTNGTGTTTTTTTTSNPSPSGLGINLSTWFSGWKSKGNNSNNSNSNTGNSSSSSNSNTSGAQIGSAVLGKNTAGSNSSSSSNSLVGADISQLELEEEEDNICNSIDTTSSGNNKVVLREGFLNKQGHLRKNWLCRYFILTSKHLEYYNKDKQTLINKIPLGECDISMADIEIKKSHCFKITHKGTKRSFYLFSNEKPNTMEFERDSYEWIGAIQEVIDTINSSSDRSPSTTNVVVEGHRSYELVHCISHALLYSLGKISAASLTDLCLEDFQASETTNVNKEQSLSGSMNGSSISNGNSLGGSTGSTNSINSGTSQYSYKFTDYAPKVFRKIRELSNVNSADYMISLTQNSLLEEPSQGRSNSFFYFTSDKKLLIKTITTAEYEQLSKILPNYYFHLSQNPDSLIIRFYGLHYISPSKMKNTHFVVMENIFSTVEMDEVYDLKGSTLNRKANGKKVLMDLDFCTRIFISEELKLKFYKQIESDCNFLEKNGSMDYSLLLGIHYLKGKKLDASEIEAQNQSNSTSPSLFRKEMGGMIARTSTGELYDKIYYLSIIDILTVYNIKKQIEHTYKSVAYDTADSMSAVDPSTYNKRFKHYIQKVTGWTNNANNNSK
ncbi:pleckstrin (PH) domain-containing protein [Tieghemostelium lacteum]|uniref:Pleckstrin (PH) domain-containing protein n=1 Tax=Tieghemostelium lacteum TaxID=361077 RepID=A0A151ZKC3_TIELA|nr:pleckstrin (PH) domain-containing protein [Tieghemostelium lacteum]|eukprot:KYQ94365.1 pleckstrin (PH) domain-containing protein [Tieghemostelium lacteum]